jgi:diadenosine tetraphosphate (Ap4A) HIT family hydrolase
MVSLQPVAHRDLADLPPALSQALGPTIQRVERAMLTLPGTGRVHVNKWGDGGAHLHIWLVARPAGMMQLRGSCLVEWNDILPPLPVDMWAANLATIAATLAADGGDEFEIQPPG